MIATKEKGTAFLPQKGAFNNNKYLSQRQSNYTSRLIKHKIYDALLSCIEDRQIQTVKTGKILKYILHPLTKKTLIQSGEFSASSVEELEQSIITDAENMNDYEVVRDVPRSLYYQLEKQGQADAIFRNRIVGIPDSILNGFICAQLQKSFTESQILSVDGFVKNQWLDESGKIQTTLRIDIDQRYAKRGFMLPLMDSSRLIYAIKIYRHSGDEYPFKLRSRIGGLA